MSLYARMYYSSALSPSENQAKAYVSTGMCGHLHREGALVIVNRMGTHLEQGIAPFDVDDKVVSVGTLGIAFSGSVQNIEVFKERLRFYIEQEKALTLGDAGEISPEKLVRFIELFVAEKIACQRGLTRDSVYPAGAESLMATASTEHPFACIIFGVDPRTFEKGKERIRREHYARSGAKTAFRAFCRNVEDSPGAAEELFKDYTLYDIMRLGIETDAAALAEKHGMRMSQYTDMQPGRTQNMIMRKVLVMVPTLNGVAKGEDCCYTDFITVDRESAETSVLGGNDFCEQIPAHSGILPILIGRLKAWKLAVPGVCLSRQQALCIVSCDKQKRLNIIKNDVKIPSLR